jgi:hypothetical protein
MSGAAQEATDSRVAAGDQLWGNSKTRAISAIIRRRSSGSGKNVVTITSSTWD